MLSWGHRKQLLFISIFLFIVAAIVVSLYIYYKPIPTCFDGEKNQDELGVDCGGSCALACSSQLVPVTIWWTRVFAGSDGKYDAAALVENQNAGFGTKEIAYTLRIYDKFNVLLAERTGTTFFNPQEKFVLYEPNIDLGQKTPGQAFLYFSQAVWQKASYVPSPFSFGAKQYENLPHPHFSAKVTNITLDSLSNSKFVAVLSDVNGNVIAASQTVSDRLSGGGVQELNFTWDTPFAEEPSLKDIYPKLSVSGVE